MHNRARAHRVGTALAVLVLGLGLTVGLVVGFATSASAHPIGTTQLAVNPSGADVTLVVDVPFDQLAAATGIDLTVDPSAAIARHEIALRSLFMMGVAVSGNDGVRWPVSVDSLAPNLFEGVAHLHAELVVRRPHGAMVNGFTLEYRVITDRIAGHEVFVVTGDMPDVTVIGRLNQRHSSIVVSLDGPSSVGFLDMLRVGTDHFRAGPDHLVFLALVVAGGFAGTRHKPRALVGELLVRTSAFTVGHSTSLLLVSVGVTAPAASIVETAIAVTVLVGALRLATQAKTRRWEAVVILAFGLVHGFGFAGTIERLGTSGWNLVVLTAGFNVGIEVAQLLAAVILALPLYVLCRSIVARRTLSLAAAVVATGWIIERISRIGDPFASTTSPMLRTPEHLALTLAVAGLVVGVFGILRPALPPHTQGEHQ